MTASLNKEVEVVLSGILDLLRSNKLEHKRCAILSGPGSILTIVAISCSVAGSITVTKVGALQVVHRCVTFKKSDEPEV